MPKASESCFQAPVGLASSYKKALCTNQCEGGRCLQAVLGVGEQRIHARPRHWALRRVTCEVYAYSGVHVPSSESMPTSRG